MELTPGESRERLAPALEGLAHCARTVQLVPAVSHHEWDVNVEADSSEQDGDEEVDVTGRPPPAGKGKHVCTRSG